MPAAPSALTAVGQATYNELSWTNNDVYESVEIYRKGSHEGSWNLYDTVGSGVSSYNDNDYATYEGYTVQYKIRGDNPALVWSDYSDVAELTRYTDTVTDACDVVDSKTEGVSDTLSEIVGGQAGIGESYNEGISNTITDTCSVADSVAGSQSVKSLFAFYWGTSDGYVHTYSDAYKSDNGVSILSSWRSKTTDFSELDPKLAGRWKTVYRVKLIYRDLETSTPAIVSISNDCGTSWASYTKNVGTGTLATQSRDYWVTPISGEFFEFRVEYPSSNKTFQFLGLDIEFEPFGERVDTA